MPDVEEHAIGLPFGRWRSRPLYTGVGLGVFSVRGEHPKRAVEIADQLEIGREWVYRLRRALGSLESFEESPERRFSLAQTVGVEDWSRLVADDIFKIVADGYGYLMTVIRHGWNGDGGREILSRIWEPAPVEAQLFISEDAVPYPEKPRFVRSSDGNTKAHD